MFETRIWVMYGETQRTAVIVETRICVMYGETQDTDHDRMHDEDIFLVHFDELREIPDRLNTTLNVEALRVSLTSPNNRPTR